jgi:predicted N-acetyltransferase YhbS
VTLIRHAHVRTEHRRRGVGSRPLRFLVSQAHTPCLVGTWAAADRAIRFYQKHGFQLVTPEEKDRLLPLYWGVPPRQIKPPHSKWCTVHSGSSPLGGDMRPQRPVGC